MKSIDNIALAVAETIARNKNTRLDLLSPRSEPLSHCNTHTGTLQPLPPRCTVHAAHPLLGTHILIVIFQGLNSCLVASRLYCTFFRYLVAKSAATFTEALARSIS